MGPHAHKKRAPASVRIGILSVSSTRSLPEDDSGHWIAKRSRKEGHRVVFHEVLPDDAERIRQRLFEALDTDPPDVVLLTGGTGISPMDVTIESVRPLFQKELTAFGAVFSQISYEQVDSAAILSRAAAGIIRSTVVFCMPGSLKACKLACKALIFPELAHIVAHIHE